MKINNIQLPENQVMLSVDFPCLCLKLGPKYCDHTKILNLLIIKYTSIILAHQVNMI